MNCPMFIDYGRECQYKIGFLPLDTTGYCTSEKYKDCPFFKAINGIGHACTFLKQCPAFEHFKAHQFSKFVEIAEQYCLSEENNPKCRRYQLRKKGIVPPWDLMPDGSTFKE